MIMDTLEVLLAVENERNRQIAKWGDQRHRAGDWLLILMEEIGEVSKAMLERKDTTIRNEKHITEELIQCAAVLTAWIEDYTRADDPVVMAQLRQLYGGMDDDPRATTEAQP